MIAMDTTFHDAILLLNLANFSKSSRPSFTPLVSLQSAIVYVGLFALFRNISSKSLYPLCIVVACPHTHTLSYSLPQKGAALLAIVKVALNKLSAIL